MSRSDLEIPIERLRWRCDRDWLRFDTTGDIEPATGVVAQDDALEALRFGIEMPGAGQNIFVRGLTGTGRSSLVRQLLKDVQSGCPPAPDRCYVQNFLQPDCPILISFPPGRGREFRKLIDALIEYIEQQLGPALSSESMRLKRASTEEHVQESIRELGRPFEDELRANDLALVPVQMGPLTQPVILPVFDGKPASYDDLEKMRSTGALDADRLEDLQEKISRFTHRFSEINHKIREIQAGYQAQLQKLNEDEARSLLEIHIAAIKKTFPGHEVGGFLDLLADDVVQNRLDALKDAREFIRLYRVNVVQSHDSDDSCPIVVETTPTLQGLLGSIEREFVAGGVLRSDHMMIRGGSLLRADGGYLILEARDVLSEPGAWKVLLRTLRTGKLEIVPSELSTFWLGPLLKPQAIELNVKVILIGDPDLHQMLDALDHDFPHLFKVLADFETTIGRDEAGVGYYAGVLARIARDESLPHYTRDAVAALTEHGARIAGRRDRLTTRFGRVADIAREAAYLTTKAGRKLVDGSDVLEAIRRGRHRADLPARHFRKLVTEGTIRVQTEGKVVGQVNGLAVVHAGPLTYGFPTRITATIGPGSAGAINIEREAELSGAIHTKGFYILGGLLRHLLRTEHPLAFSASIAFEQSYGGIDGDSASGAEMCCLMSALTGVALDQGVAMTGAIDQHGHIQPIGAVSEKVEGFFAVCRDRGLNGRQGVLIPALNASDLMLNHEVLEASESGQFHIYMADTIFDALEVLTEQPVPPRGEDGRYPGGTLLHLAQHRAREFWRLAMGGEALSREPPDN